MEKQIIWRGLLAGVVAGVLAFVFARILVEPRIARAVGYEEGLGAAHEALESAAHPGHSHRHSHGGGFDRAVQMNIGMGLGVLLFSLAVAALLAVVFAVAYGRLGDISARLLSVYIAGGMLLSLYLVPALKYPPSPPGLGLDETIRQRTLLYLLVIALSAALLVGAVRLARRLAPRLGAWNAALVAAGGYLVAVVAMMLVLPSVGQTPGPLRDDAGNLVYEGFPADVLYEFRLYSLGTQIVIYTTIALVFGAMAAKLLGESRRGGARALRTGASGAAPSG